MKFVATSMQLRRKKIDHSDKFMELATHVLFLFITASIIYIIASIYFKGTIKRILIYVDSCRSDILQIGGRSSSYYIVETPNGTVYTSGSYLEPHKMYTCYVDQEGHILSGRDD
jgi:hypothetical protein